MFKSAWHHLVDDYGKIHLGVKLLVLIVFLRAMGWGFADPFFSLYLNQFTLDYALIGLLSALVAFTALLTIIPLMRLTDKIQEGVLIRDGQVLYLFVILAYVLGGLFLNFPLLIFGLALNGIAQTLIMVGVEAYIRQHDGGGKSGPFGFYTAMDYLGWALGMLAAAFLVHLYSLNLMFLFILPSIFLSFLILPQIHEHGLRSILTGLKRYFHKRQDFVDLLTDFRNLNPKMAFLLTLAFFDGAIRMFAYVFIPLFAVSLKLDLKSIALLMVVMNVPYIFSYFFSELSDVVNKMKVIAIGLFIGFLAFVLLYTLVNQWWVLGLAALTSLSIAIIRPAYNGLITKFTPRGKTGEVTGIYNFVDRIGRIVGPVLTGAIADAYGLNITFLLIAIASLGLGLMSLALRSYGDPEPALVADVV